MSDSKDSAQASPPTELLRGKWYANPWFLILNKLEVQIQISVLKIIVLQSNHNKGGGLWSETFRCIKFSTQQSELIFLRWKLTQFWEILLHLWELSK